MSTTLNVSINDLKNALSQVRPCVANSAGDITSHYVFRPHEEDGMAVYGWSGKIFAFAPINGTTYDGVEAFTIEAKRLDQWLSTLGDSVVVDFTYNEGTVVAKAPRGKNIFQSLDPASFPWWDAIWDSAEETGKVRADLFRSAINHSRPFICDDETKQPKLCVLECRDGNLRCTDLTAMSQATVPGLENCKIRLHGKDLGALNSFLALQSDGEVTIYETDRAQFFGALDGKGAVFGESRPLSAFPNVNVDNAYVENWELDKTEVISAIKFLASGASWDDNTLTLTRNGSEVVLSMASTTGDILEQELAQVGIEDQTDDSSYTFNVSRLHLTRLLSLCTEDSVFIKVNQKKNNGWIFIEENDSNGFEFNTAITWLHSRQKTTSVNTNVSAATNVTANNTGSVETSA